MRSKVARYFAYNRNSTFTVKYLYYFQENELEQKCRNGFFNGREFSSFEELNYEMSMYEKRFFVNLYVCSSRTIESAKRRAPTKHFVKI